MQADKVIIFHSKYYAMPEEKTSYTTVPHYEERASGDFELPKDAELKTKFEQIKALITCNR
ncbi:MAG: hypothetical protein B7Y52_05765 [Sulfurovum sp. 28-43-6]|nr:MAG: hypothetical protein B7Y52_05765 [Sulfurovum sp. 28-43-6]